jgi:hypothetical protein
LKGKGEFMEINYAAIAGNIMTITITVIVVLALYAVKTLKTNVATGTWLATNAARFGIGSSSCWGSLYSCRSRRTLPSWSGCSVSTPISRRQASASPWPDCLSESRASQPKAGHELRKRSRIFSGAGCESRPLPEMRESHLPKPRRIAKCEI